jgi:hypothetical protein
MDTNRKNWHHRHTLLCDDFGNDASAFLGYIGFYMNINYKKNKTEAWRDGYVWTFSNTKRMVDYTHGINEFKLKRIINSLVKNKIILVGKYSKGKTHNVRWVTIIDKDVKDILLSFEQPNDRFYCRKENKENKENDKL